MASDCKGLEVSLVDYSISVPALFFSLIAHFEPSNVLRFASVLQDVLGIRRAELLKYWRVVSGITNMKASSHMEGLAIDYISKIDSYGKSLSPSDDISQNPDFIRQSYLATCKPDLLGQQDMSFQVEGTEFCLRFKPTLFGFHLRGVYKCKAEVQRDKSNEWDPFCPKYTLDEAWKYMTIPIAFLSNDEEHISKPADIADLKESIVKKHGSGADKPSIDMLCFVLAELARRQDFKDEFLCLVNCRYVVSVLFGYSLLRPSEVAM